MVAVIKTNLGEKQRPIFMRDGFTHGKTPSFGKGTETAIANSQLRVLR